jgi:alginate O-acetyltransferase complex protein AlgI
VLDVVLPVGISFYTFQSLSYTLEVARGGIEPVRRFQDFALFVAFFPPMVAGPIERARNLLPQLQNPRKIRLKQSVDGVLLILLGLMKKVAIADGVAPSVAAIYGTQSPVSASDVALATVLFAFQIFCDFSGYSDIARGVSKLLGIEIMVNFNLPYFSRNPSEFWRRWHISLSSWLRDYLYIALGGNRKGSGRTYFNLMATMTLGGLWHGAAANFILWGFYQGALLCGHRLATSGAGASELNKVTIADPSGYDLFKNGVKTTLQIGVMFIFVCYGWMLFRAVSFDQIVQYTTTLAGFGPSAPSFLPRPPLSAMLGLAVLFCLQLADFRKGRQETFRDWPVPVQGALYAVMIFLLAMGMSNEPAQFIYFQF